MLLFLSLLCCVVLSIPGEGLMSVLLFFFFSYSLFSSRVFRFAVVVDI
jgi:hypothetical protein